MDKKFAKDAFWAVASKAFALGIRFFAGIMLTRGLTPAGRGVFAIMQSVPALVNTFAEFGIRQSIVRLVGNARADQVRVIGNVSSLWILTSVIGSLCVFLCFQLGLFKVEASDSSYVLAAILVFPNIASSYARGIFLGKGRLKVFNAITWGAEAAFLVCVLFLFLTNAITVHTALLSLLVSSTCAAAASIFFVWRSSGLHLHFDRTTSWSILSLGGVYGLNSGLTMLLYRAPLLLMGWLSAPVQIGLYAVAVSVAELLWQLPNTMGQVVLSRSTNAADDFEFAKNVALLHRVTFPVFLGLAVVAGGFFQVAIPYFYGEAFAGSIPMVWGLLPGIALFSSYKLLQTDLAGKGRIAVTIRVLVVPIVFNSAFGSFAIRQWHGVGAAVCASLSYALAALLLAGTYRRLYNLSWADLFLPRPHEFKSVIKQFRGAKKAKVTPLNSPDYTGRTG